MKLVVVLFVLWQSAGALELATVPDQGQVLFKATALGLRFEGKGRGADGLVRVGEKIEGQLNFELNTLDTGLELRNSHMKEKYLETAKFPHGRLIIQNIVGFDEKVGVQELSFEGLLTIRGVEKAVRNGRVKLAKTASGYEVLATFGVKMSDFEIPLPKYAGVVVKDDLQVEAKLTFAEKLG